MFERYTERARRVIFFARYEASQCGSPNIEPEHLLLGLIREEKKLTHDWLTLEDIKHILSTIRSRSENREKISTSVDLPLSSASKQVLSAAAEQAGWLSDPNIGTGHLLLGLLSQKSCLSVELLIQSGITTQRVLQALQENNFDRLWDLASLKESGSRLAGFDLGSARGTLATMFHRYNNAARRTVFLARNEACRLGAQRIEPEHLLLALMREDEVLRSVRLRPEDVEKIRSTIESTYKSTNTTLANAELPLSPECKALLDSAAKQANRYSHEHIGTEHMLLGLLSQKSLASELLLQYGVTANRVLMCLKKSPAAVRPKAQRSSSFPGAWPDAT